MFILSHKIKLDPTMKQDAFLRRCCGVARFTWNYALAEWIRAYEAGEKPTANMLKARFNAIRREQFPWTYEVGRDCTSQPFADLGKAFSSFFAKQTRYPKFKKKCQHDAFYLANNVFAVDGERARLPHIGWIRMREALRFDGRILSGRVVHETDGWYLAIQVELPDDYHRPRSGDDTVGVDLGVKTAVVLSTGEQIDSPKPLKKHLKRLRHLQRQFSRKQKGSKNSRKAASKVARLHKRIANIRSDWTHKVTSRLCRENQAVAIEDLNVSGMLANHNLARAISDIGFREIRRQLEYKLPLHGGVVLLVDRWYPSSRLCSDCGAKHETLTLSDRTFVCPSCGVVRDRDLNAALNIRTAGLAGIACGLESSDGASRETIRDEAGTIPCSLVGT